MAAAYLELEDFDMARKFYEKDIKQRSVIILNRNFFKIQLEKIEQNSHTYNHQSILPFLPDLFRSLVDKIQKIVTLKDSNISTLVDSFVQCAAIRTRLSSHLEAIKAYVTAFGLYASESKSTNNELKQTLIDIMTSILNDFIECKLKSQEIIDTYVQLSSPNESNKTRLKLITMYRDNGIGDMHGISYTSYESHTAVLHHYKALLTTTNDMNLRSVCYYNILHLYKHHLHPDEQDKNIVDGLVDCLPKLNILDRRLLATMATDFLHEYDASSCERIIDKNRQISAKSSLDNQPKDSEEPYIGLFLLEVGNLSAAEAYWRSIIKQIKHNFSSRAFDLIQDSDTTLKEILQATEHFERDNKLLCNRLATAYEKLADYFMHDATTGEEINGDSFVKAVNMYKEAINLLELLNTGTNRIDHVKMKHQKAEETTRQTSQEEVKESRCCPHGPNCRCC
jgi:tetratricopeptide (TPR) repeat protein